MTSGKSSGTPHGEPKEDSKNADHTAADSKAGKPTERNAAGIPGEKHAPSTPGRIVHDSRGNAVWSWGQTDDSGSTATTSKMLKKLDVGDLRMEDEPPSQKPPEPGKQRGSGYGPGYNPYDRSAPVRVMPKKNNSR
jgi:hypothetical protein